MYHTVKELLNTLEIVEMDKVNPSLYELMSVFLDNEDADAVSYYITGDITKRQILDTYIGMKKYEIERDQYHYDFGVRKEPDTTFYKNNTPGMLYYDIITEFSPDSIFVYKGQELSKDIFRDVEFIPNFLLSLDSKIQIKNSEYVKVITLKLGLVQRERSKPCFKEGNAVITKGMLFCV